MARNRRRKSRRIINSDEIEKALQKTAAARSEASETDASTTRKKDNKRNVKGRAVSTKAPTNQDISGSDSDEEVELLLEDIDTNKNHDDDDDPNVYKKKSQSIKTRTTIAERDMQYEYGISADVEINLPFCCALCRCTKKWKGRIPENDQYIWPDMDHLIHRRCCHGIFIENELVPPDDDSNNDENSDDNKDFTGDSNDEKDRNEDDTYGIRYYSRSEIHQWTAPYRAFQDAAIFNPDKASNPPNHYDWVTYKEIETAYKTAKSQEAQVYNDDGLADPFHIPRTNPDYHRTIEIPFNSLIKEIKNGSRERRRCTVLDCFAGVGTGVVVLKRLNIDIAKVIHVEHDKIATHVYRHNHDNTYNHDLPEDGYGGIEHVFIDKFEELRGSYDSIWEEYGPIDIIIGGPPCIDFSHVNARREGVQGSQGKYMLEFGALIRKFEELQKPHPLFFLAENVCLSGDDLAATLNAFQFGWDPICLDAQYVSPTRRNRHFLTNIAYINEGHTFDFQGDDSHIGPEKCLEDGFVLPVHLVDPKTTAKAQCLMASKNRIDERRTLRMYVFKRDVKQQQNGEIHIHGRPMKVSERELLMGYKKGYIEIPVMELFHELNVNGLAHIRRAECQYEPQLHWEQSLPNKLHHFAGNYHSLPGKDPYRLYLQKKLPNATNDRNKNDECIEAEVLIKMAPRVDNVSVRPVHYTAEEYCKHLIGLAYSVPVVEHLLKPLQEVFATRQYKSYNYKYAWHDDDQGEGKGNNDDDNFDDEANDESNEWVILSLSSDNDDGSKDVDVNNASSIYERRNSTELEEQVGQENDTNEDNRQCSIAKDTRKDGYQKQKARQAISTWKRSHSKKRKNHGDNSKSTNMQSSSKHEQQQNTTTHSSNEDESKPPFVASSSTAKIGDDKSKPHADVTSSTYSQSVGPTSSDGTRSLSSQSRRQSKNKCPQPVMIYIDI